MALALGELSSVHPGAGSFGLYGGHLPQPVGRIYRSRWILGRTFHLHRRGAGGLRHLSCLLASFGSGAGLGGDFFSLLLLINLRSVDNYARFEYWFAMIKVATIVAFIVLGAALLLSGRVAPQYTVQGGFLPQRAACPASGDWFRDLYICRNRIRGRHHRRIAFSHGYPSRH